MWSHTWSKIMRKQIPVDICGYDHRIVEFFNIFQVWRLVLKFVKLLHYCHMFRVPYLLFRSYNMDKGFLFRARHSHVFLRIDIKKHKYLILESKRKGQEGTHIFGRPFVTAEWTVVQVTIAVAVVELGLLGLIIRQVRVFSFMCHGLFSLSRHRHEILERLYCSRIQRIQIKMPLLCAPSPLACNGISKRSRSIHGCNYRYIITMFKKMCIVSWRGRLNKAHILRAHRAKMLFDSEHQSSCQN